jgi:hypothetical protein
MLSLSSDRQRRQSVVAVLAGRFSLFGPNQIQLTRYRALKSKASISNAFAPPKVNAIEKESRFSLERFFQRPGLTLEACKKTVSPRPSRITNAWLASILTILPSNLFSFQWIQKPVSELWGNAGLRKFGEIQSTCRYVPHDEKLSRI